jgi:hypothetical protein
MHFSHRVIVYLSFVSTGGYSYTSRLQIATTFVMHLMTSTLTQSPLWLFTSQAMSAQIARWLVVLSASLFSVHHCQPLLDLFAEQAMAAGCHQHEDINSHSPMDMHMGKHIHHH